MDLYKLGRNNVKRVIIIFLLAVSYFNCNIKLAANAFEKHITIVVSGYNNRMWYQRNLDSILSQNYNNYNVIYTDDCSSDGTYELVKKYISKSDKKNIFKIIKNIDRKYALLNYYRAIHLCEDSSIIVMLDADDWFPHGNVLGHINKIYSKNSVWLTYGQYMRYPSGALGHAFPVPQYIIRNNAFREIFPFPFSHLRTFYAWLFKKIDHKDLLDKNGEFFKTAYDVAIMMPMVEMAKNHFICLNDILYIYNTATSINDHKISRKKQHETSVYMRKTQSKYRSLD